jgi:hypothetical protein
MAIQVSVFAGVKVHLDAQELLDLLEEQLNAPSIMPP